MSCVNPLTRGSLFVLARYIKSTSKCEALMINFFSKLLCLQFGIHSWLLLQLEDGDIVCFQKPPQMGSNEQCRYPDVPSFLEYMHNRQVCHGLIRENFHAVWKYILLFKTWFLYYHDLVVFILLAGCLACGVMAHFQTIVVRLGTKRGRVTGSTRQVCNFPFFASKRNAKKRRFEQLFCNIKF